MLSMTLPYRHPKTGMWWVRKTVPQALRAAVGRRELKKSLGTKDVNTAKLRAGPVIAGFERLIADARSPQTVEPLTLREIDALAAEWYRGEVTTWGDNPDQFGDLDIYTGLMADQIEDGGDATDPTAVDVVKLSAHDIADAGRTLKARDYHTDPASVSRLALAIFWMKFRLAKTLGQRLAGDWSEDKTATLLPPVAPRVAPGAPPKLTIGALIGAWATERGTAGKALYDRAQAGKMLATFLGHDDAARVGADDAIRWKEARLAEGKSTKTVANDLGKLRPIWQWAKANRKLTGPENPFAGIAPRPTREDKRQKRGPFTETEARQILTAARTERKALLRWVPWLACFTGARLTEIVQSVKEDVRHAGGVWFLAIHEAGPGRKLKTLQSERFVPLHPALIGEGFLDYVRGLPDGSALFPAVKPDLFGSRGGTATKAHGRWVRNVAGVTDRSKDPAHGWRHRFEDELKRAMPGQRSIIDAIMGHDSPAQGDSYGSGGYRFMIAITAPEIAKVPSPLG